MKKLVLPVFSLLFFLSFTVSLAQTTTSSGLDTYKKRAQAAQSRLQSISAKLTSRLMQAGYLSKSKKVPSDIKLASLYTQMEKRQTELADNMIKLDIVLNNFQATPSAENQLSLKEHSREVLQNFNTLLTFEKGLLSTMKQLASTAAIKKQ